MAHYSNWQPIIIVLVCPDLVQSQAFHEDVTCTMKEQHVRPQLVLDIVWTGDNYH